MNLQNGNINVFVDSSKRLDKLHEIYDFNVNIPTNLINCDNNEGLRLNVVYFSLLNSMNNVNYTNCHFDIVFTDNDDEVQSSTSFTIAYGIYDVKTFRNYINTLCNDIFSISYNKYSNSYTFTKTYTGQFDKVKLNIIDSGAFFGLSNGDVLELSSGGYTGGCVNMAGFKKVLLLVKGLQYEDATIDNFDGDGFEESEVLCWFSRQDVPPFQSLIYKNEDGGDLFNYRLFNKNVNLINLQIVDENMNFITDVPDYQLILQFEIYQRDSQESVRLLSTISTYIKQIYTILLMLLEGLKII